MSWQEECIYLEWQGPPPLAGQEFFPQNQPLKLTDSQEDAQKRDVPEHVPMARVNSWELRLGTKTSLFQTSQEFPKNLPMAEINPAGNQNQRSIKV